MSIKYNIAQKSLQKSAFNPFGHIAYIWFEIIGQKFLVLYLRSATHFTTHGFESKCSTKFWFITEEIFNKLAKVEMI